MAKRRLEDERIFTIPKLPYEILAQVMVYHGAPAQLARVCKYWRDLTQKSYDNVDWLGILTRRARSSELFAILMTGGKMTFDSIHYLTVARYFEEISQRVTSEWRASGLAHEFVLFLIYAFNYCIEQRSAEVGTQFVQSNCLLQSALYYARDVEKKPLAIANFHKRDFRITFFEEGHVYQLVMRDPELNGPWYIATNVSSPLPGVWSNSVVSGTGLYHPLFEAFDEDVVADRMMRSKKWNNPVLNKEYYGMTKPQILEHWQLQRELGTAMHLNLEYLCNDDPCERESIPMQHFAKFEAKHITGKLVPFRSEALIYNERLMIVGSPDILYWSTDPQGRKRNKEGKLPLTMMDWKRAKNLEADNKFQKGIHKGTTDDLEDTKINHYSIQLDNYTVPLEESYDYEIGDRRSIVGLHPAQETYIKYDVPLDLSRRAAIMQYRETAVKKQRAERCMWWEREK